MFGPDWTEGCVGCSFELDHIEGRAGHLEHHDVSYVVVSRAPLAKTEPFRQRMGWRVKWVSSYGNDFNYDFNVSFTPEQIAAGKATYNYQTRARDRRNVRAAACSTRTRPGQIFHTYSSFARGGEMFLGSYAFLDITPKAATKPSTAI